MKRQIRCQAALALATALALAGGNLLQAANPAPTKIIVNDMHCQGCAKSVTAKLYEVRGVATVQVNMPAKTVIVTPQAQTVLSPRDLWEAVEKAGKHPTRLEGPSGTFTTKPQS